MPPSSGGTSQFQSQNLQSRLNLKSPGFQQSLRNVLRIFIPTGPLTEPGGPNVLVRCQFEFLYYLFEGCYRRDNRPNRLRLAPVRISTTLCHIVVSTSFKLTCVLRTATPGKITAAFILRQLCPKSKEGREVTHLRHHPSFHIHLQATLLPQLCWAEA